MNYTETFEEFAARSTVTDLALYAGAAIILWILFKEKFPFMQKGLGDIVNKVKTFFVKQPTNVAAEKPTIVGTTNKTKEDLFFDLVSSWKNTRDLAKKSHCEAAVRVADQMFPYLSPSGCNEG
jgi:hypothetical protein